MSSLNDLWSFLKKYVYLFRSCFNNFDSIWIWFLWRFPKSGLIHLKHLNVVHNKYHKKFSHIWQQFLSKKADAGNSLICVKWKSNEAFMDYYLYSTSVSPFLLSLDLKKGSFKTGAYSWFLSILKSRFWNICQMCISLFEFLYNVLTYRKKQLNFYAKKSYLVVRRWGGK